MKKIMIESVKKTALAAICAVAMGMSFTGCIFNDFGKASMTAKKLAPELYYMEFKGDDCLEDFLARGGASSSAELGAFLEGILSKGPFKTRAAISTGDYGCAAFLAKDSQSNPIAGRNYDWENCTTLILKDVPTDGYASISTCCLDFLGFGEGFAPDSMVNKLKALAGLYVPLDGINEKGLVVADLMAGDREVTSQQTDKKDLTTTTAIRVLLNKAATVEEAVAILEQYDMHSDIGTAHHLFIADAKENSVIVEWNNNQMYVTQGNVLTNHYMGTPKAGTGSANSKERFNIAKNTLDQKQWTISMDDARDILDSINAYRYGSATQWSIAYNMDVKNPGLKFYWRGDYKKCYNYSVK